MQNFVGLLGYDFMQKHNATFNHTDNTISIKNISVPIVSQNTNTHSQVNATHNNNEHTQVVNSNVYIAKKTILEQNAISSVDVFTECDNNTFLFEPINSNSNFEIFASIHTPMDNLNKSKLYHFTIYIHNISHEHIHLNKGQIVGTIAPVDSIDDDKLKVTDNIEHFCNLIQASQEIIQQRKLQLFPEDFKISHLDTHQQQQLLTLLMEKYAAFSKDLKTLGHTDKVIPQISFMHQYPIKCLPFPIPQALHAEAKQQLTELQEAGIIERANTEWACPMLFVKKKPVNGEKPRHRMALDLRLLNNIVKSSSYPLPKITDIISNLSLFKYFTVLDLSNAYWQINLPEQYRNIIAFTTPWGSFKFNRLAQGLKTSASWFQSMVDTIIEEINITGLHSYQDDLVIAANSFEEMLNKIQSVLDQLLKYNITAAPSKCCFFQTEINYLGFQVSHTQIKPIKANIIKITSFPTPKTKRQTKKFIGLCGYYRNLLPKYAELIQPLIDISKFKADFKWTDTQQHSFDTLQRIFFSEPFVKLPQWDKEFFVNTDASLAAISGILMQEFDGILHPISYFSKTLTPAEKRYPAIKLELMGIYKTITAFKYYLYNRQFTVLTDSKPLLHYKKTSIPTDITTRWLLELSQYTINFKHIPGKENMLADYFSRLQETPPHIDITQDKNLITTTEILPIVEQSEEINALNVSTSNTTTDPLLEISNHTILTEQLKDNKIKKIYQSVTEHKFNKLNSNFFINPDTKVLCYNQTSNTDYSNYINPSVRVLPPSLHAKALSIAHLPHYGIHKTYDFLRNRYHWYGMYSDTVNFVRSCERCVITKNAPIPQAPLQSAPVYTKPNVCVSLDILGPLSNNQYILTIIDHFSKHLELYPLTKITANNVTDCLFDYISTHGRVGSVLTDLGTQFTSQVFTKFNQVLGIKINNTTPHHAQCNTSAERPNKQIKSTVEALLAQGFPFMHAIRIHKMMYNASKHTTTGFSPNLIHFGRPLSLIFDTYNPSVELENPNINDYISNVFKSLKYIYEQTTSNIMTKQIEQNTKKNTKTKLRKFNIKDIVYLKSRDRYNHRLDGPFSIIQQHNDVNYSIQLLDNPQAAIFKVHIDRLQYVAPRKPLLANPPIFSPHNSNSDNNSNPPLPHNYFLRSRH